MTSDRWRFRTRRAAFRVSRMVAARRSRRFLAPGWWRAWVRAARWTAALALRLPPRLRRWGPLAAPAALETGIGAVPLWRGGGGGGGRGGGGRRRPAQAA